MSHVGLGDKYLKSLLPRKGVKLLDVGHGYGQIGLMVKAHTMGDCELWGVEIYPPYHEFQKRLGIYDHLILGNALETTLPDKTVDYTIASHVIEHLEKDDGYKLLKEMERVTRRKVIVTTPKGRVPAEEKDGNIFNMHKAGWEAEDFKADGYEVHFASLDLNSRALQAFGMFWYALNGRKWNNPIIIATKDVEGQ